MGHVNHENTLAVRSCSWSLLDFKMQYIYKELILIIHDIIKDEQDYQKMSNTKTTIFVITNSHDKLWVMKL